MMTPTLREAAQAALDYLMTPNSKLLPAGTLYRVSDELRAAIAAQPAPDAPVAFDAEGFRAWVARELPDDTLIGSSAYWADHLTAWARRFVKAGAAPIAQQAVSVSDAVAVLAALQKPLDHDIAKILHDNLWGLMVEDGPVSQQAGQTVAWHIKMRGCDGSADWCELGSDKLEAPPEADALPLVYAQQAAPAQARQPLPFDELVRMIPQYPPSGQDIIDFGRSIEAAHGISAPAAQGVEP
jgi:hypothetical protein